MKLEKELQARIFLHKVAIVKSTLAHVYIVGEKRQGGLMLSEPCLEQNAMKFADTAMQDILQRGILDKAYDEAWEVVKDYIPDSFSVI